MVNRSGKGYCRKHYDQIREYGQTIEERSRYCQNEINKYDDYAEIILTDGHMNQVAIAKVSLSDVEMLKQHRWSIKDNGYVRTVINGKTEYMHRLITKATSGEEVDHINRDILDNTRQNLRKVQHYINMHNRSNSNNCVVKITNRKLAKPYAATTTVNCKRIWLGYHETAQQARAAVMTAKRALI